VELSNVPGCGYVPVDWRISEAEPAEAPPGGPDGRHASNGLLALTLNADGTVDVTDARTGMVHSRCGALLDEGDVGDEYTYSPPARDTRVTSAQSSDVQILRVHNGPLRHTFAIDATLRVPVRAACDRRERVAETTALRVSTLVTLDRGADFVKWQVTVENNAEDHRLRIMFPAGASRPEFAIADSAFGVVQRPTTARSQASLEKPVEAPVAYAPLQTFVAVADAQRGMAVIADGLTEYEVLDDGTPQLAITLLRAVGALSRDDLSTRPHGHAGPGLATPGAQCLGTHTFRLAAASVAGEVDPRALYATAARVLTPPRAWTQAASGGRRASSMSVVQIQGDVVLSACKRADDREALVLRYFNPSAHVASIQIQLAKPIREAYLLNLREERQETLATVGGALQRRVRPHGIETIEVSSP
jgi:alpha-mannosidase